METILFKTPFCIFAVPLLMGSPKPFLICVHELGLILGFATQMVTLSLWLKLFCLLFPLNSDELNRHFHKGTSLPALYKMDRPAC